MYAWGFSSRTRVVINTVYQFVGPDLSIEIFFEKEGQQNMGTLIFKQGIERPLHTRIGVEQNFMQSPSAFLLFFGDKKNSF